MNTFEQLAKLSPDEIRDILATKGPRYRIHNPTTWPKQAELASQGLWDELREWQDTLDGGKL